MAGLLSDIIRFGVENWYVILFVFLVFVLFVIFKIRTMNKF